MARQLLVVGVLLVVSGCGGSSKKDTQEPGPPPQVEEKLPPFHARPVKATVVPRRGHRHTVFRIRFRPRGFVGVRARARHDYEANLFDRTNARAGCIIDTSGFAGPGRGPLEIVLNPRQQKGGLWCRGIFRGKLSYYRTFACPDEGTCRIPKGFPDERGVVARLSFEVR
ncbi:MAG: hypothetical protein QOH76_3801 [Thermoleophilaceae bacterium]|jgi:hypothetical protein|nr:hypothetical protein [Thermoleophilaceae bacterium]